MAMNKQNNIDLVYAILHSIQRSLDDQEDICSLNVVVKNKKAHFRQIKLNHIVYDDRAQWEIKDLNQIQRYNSQFTS